MNNLFAHKKTSTNPVGLVLANCKLFIKEIILQLYEEYHPLIAQTLLVMNC